jgi:hypothetical protein
MSERRSLCAFGDEDRHCQRPGERNVFSHTNPTPAPNDPNKLPGEGGPTIAPIASPTDAGSPTDSPVGTPTNAGVPTDAPVGAPGSPTAAPVEVPTAAPSASAAPSTSFSPSSTPSVSAAPSASASPTSIDDRAPEFPETCVSDDGNFGVTNRTLANQLLVTGFQYQVQTTIALRAENLNSQVLAQLEEALSNLLVPPLFNGDELCQFDRRRSLQQTSRDLQQTALAPAIGLLSAPADRILLGSEGGTYNSKKRLPNGGLEFTCV